MMPLALLMLLGLTISVYARDIHAEKNQNYCTRETCGKDNTCQCFCAYKCDFREQESNDKPFFSEKHNVCFCKDRDLTHLPTAKKHRACMRRMKQRSIKNL